MNQHYDVIIIGTGAGGGTVAHELAPTGKKILILERGEFLPREKENWSPKEVYQDHRYYTNEEWRGGDGEVLHPQACYWGSAEILKSMAQLCYQCENGILMR